MQKLRDLIQIIYPEDTDEIINALSLHLKNIDHIDKKHWDWYKKAQIYVTYPDAFYIDDKCDFNTLESNLTHIHNLGCNAIHILPFLKSPMIDAGFDISDYLNVREDLGRNEAFEKFLTKAKSLDLKIFMDLILNHASDQHEWFKLATSGEDESYRDYFIHTITRPNLTRKYSDKSGEWAEYEIDGKITKMRIIFPEQAGEIPHWEQAADGYWYYHTFYPHQIDIDWNNPDVFIEFAKIFIHWAEKGLNFRLDAIPFIGKDILHGITESSDKAHQIVQAFHYIIQKVSPNSVFLVEANQTIKDTKKYFGKDNVESELAYNFQLNTAIWTALIAQNPVHIWEILEQSKNIPDWGTWITFLRNHDQLSFEYVNDETRLLLYDNLEKKGMSFMEGFGLAGRTASFLDDNPQKIVLAHFLLASLPGVPAIYYGDEIGKLNDIDNMEVQTEKKRSLTHHEHISHDTRDINRGAILEEDLKDKKAQKIYNQISNIYKARQIYNQISTTYPHLIPETENFDQTLFTAKYEIKKSNLEVYINLSDQKQQFGIKNPKQNIISINEAVIANQKLILPQYSGIWLKY